MLGCHMAYQLSLPLPFRPCSSWKMPSSTSSIFSPKHLMLTNTIAARIFFEKSGQNEWFFFVSIMQFMIVSYWILSLKDMLLRCSLLSVLYRWKKDSFSMSDCLLLFDRIFYCIYLSLQTNCGLNFVKDCCLFFANCIHLIFFKDNWMNAWIGGPQPFCSI